MTTSRNCCGADGIDLFQLPDIGDAYFEYNYPEEEGSPSPVIIFKDSSNGNDDIDGGDTEDCISALEGDDTINGLAGNDKLLATKVVMLSMAA